MVFAYLPFNTINLQVTASSGYWQDIQNAVDQAASQGGGDVYLPEGTFNFVNVGESWTGKRVTIPAGVSLFGAPTQRTNGLPYDGVGQNPNDQVVEWKTILVIPWNVPGPANNAPWWFSIVGDGDPNKPSRFSDIKLVGYRSIDSASTTAHGAIAIKDVAGFRVDHCYFENVVYGISASYNEHGSRGVIDHSYLVNTNGVVVPWVYDCTVFYGVNVARMRGDVWEDDVSQVLGKYTSYTVVIEDCYFEKWRHVVAANSGAHYVFRHSTIQDDLGPSLDAHGWFQTRCTNPSHGTVNNPDAVYTGGVWVCSQCGAALASTSAESDFYITQVGTRAIEVYNNKLIDSVQYDHPIQFRGSSGVIFNNIAGGGQYSYMVYMANEARDRPEGSKVWCDDIWIWGNTLLGGINLISEYDPAGLIVEGENYYFHAPHTFSYSPLTYPFVSGDPYVPPEPTPSPSPTPYNPNASPTPTPPGQTPAPTASPAFPNLPQLPELPEQTEAPDYRPLVIVVFVGGIILVYTRKRKK